MKRKGITYDVGSVMGGNWRPDYDPTVVRRELEIIRHDLHCNAVRISGRAIDRLIHAAGCALDLGLEVWLSPLRWNEPPARTLAYTLEGAKAAEALHRRSPGRVVFSVGSELTLFMRGIVEGRTLIQRIRRLFSSPAAVRADSAKGLNDHLRRVSAAVRPVFHGPVTYAALILEQVEWELFDFVGVDHYWSEKIRDRYADMLRPLFSLGKPVVVTEFGFNTTNAPAVGGALSFGKVDNLSRLLHLLPLVGRFIRPRLRTVDERDEKAQADRLLMQLGLLDSLGVDGGFIATFVFPINPYDEEPRYDLDRESASLVKSYTKGRRGTTYPDMTWEPKQSFHAVAQYYGS